MVWVEVVAWVPEAATMESVRSQNIQADARTALSADPALRFSGPIHTEQPLKDLVPYERPAMLQSFTPAKAGGFVRTDCEYQAAPLRDVRNASRKFRRLTFVEVDGCVAGRRAVRQRCCDYACVHA